MDPVYDDFWITEYLYSFHYRDEKGSMTSLYWIVSIKFRKIHHAHPFEGHFSYFMPIWQYILHFTVFSLSFSRPFHTKFPLRYFNERHIRRKSSQPLGWKLGVQLRPLTGLFSDNGSQFTFTFFKDVCRILIMKNAFTATYKLQTNGKFDGLSRTTIASLRFYK